MISTFSISNRSKQTNNDDPIEIELKEVTSIPVEDKPEQTSKPKLLEPPATLLNVITQLGDATEISFKYLTAKTAKEKQQIAQPIFNLLDQAKNKVEVKVSADPIIHPAVRAMKFNNIIAIIWFKNKNTNFAKTYNQDHIGVFDHAVNFRNTSREPLPPLDANFLTFEDQFNYVRQQMFYQVFRPGFYYISNIMVKTAIAAENLFYLSKVIRSLKDYPVNTLDGSNTLKWYKKFFENNIAKILTLSVEAGTTSLNFWFEEFAKLFNREVKNNLRSHPFLTDVESKMLYEKIANSDDSVTLLEVVNSFSKTFGIIRPVEKRKDSSNESNINYYSSQNPHVNFQINTKQNLENNLETASLSPKRP